MNTPKIQPGATSSSRAHRAEADEQQALGFPQAQVADWQPRAIARMGELVKNSRTLQVAMDACMHCGACTEKCHYCLGSGGPLNIPVARQEVFRRLGGS